MARHFTLTADGGSRGNPGAAGYGAVITESGNILAELFDVIGIATNNVAEYSGLIAGLREINKLDPNATVDVKMDSKLVVEQMSGRWQIKHADMRTLAQDARSAHDPSLVSYSWIPRDLNSHADRLANKALDGESQPAPRQLNYLTDRLRTGEQATNIYFVRHGETILTPDRKFSGQGALDPELTSTGLAQAELVAQEIAKLNGEVLIVSPLQRTKQTAEKITKATKLEPIFDDLWLECDFGLWDGLSVEEVKEKFPNEYQQWTTSTAIAPPQGESYDALAIRVEAGLEKIAYTYPGQTVIVVAHHLVIKIAARLAMGASAESIFHSDVAPCSISQISIWPSDGLRAVRSLNERGHLRSI